MDELFEMIYHEGDLLKTTVSILLVVFVFELVLTCIYILKSAYKSAMK